MSAFSCVIQEASAAERATAELEQRLDEHHQRHYPGEATSITWMAIPRSYMFTEGRQSTSSVISCAVKHRTTLEEREAYMRGVCDLWTDVTGCTDHEIVVSLNEIDPAPED